MIPAVAQTLAEILAGGSSLIDTEHIDFNRPTGESPDGCSLNLYCYEIRENQQMHHSAQPPDGATDGHALPVWFDVSFLVTAWDGTALGEQRLLSEVLKLLLPHRYLPEAKLAPALRGYGVLPIRVANRERLDEVALWKALALPLRPALYVTVTIPFHSPAESFKSNPILLTPTN
jgi:hypothetical protein